MAVATASSRGPARASPIPTTSTNAVGNIFDPDHINSIVAAGRADLCAVARPHLADPSWTLHSAAAQGYREQTWPLPYLSAKSQLERNLERAAQLAGPV